MRVVKPYLMMVKETPATYGFGTCFTITINVARPSGAFQDTFHERVNFPAPLVCAFMIQGLARR